MVLGEFFMSLCENLMWVCIMFLLFALCVLANIIAGVYYRVRHIGQSFNRKQLVTSILRMLAIGASTAVLAVVATVAPLVLSHLDLMDEDFGKLVSVTLITGMYVRGIVKYFKGALDTLDNILSNRNIVEELQPTAAKKLNAASNTESKPEKQADDK